MKNIQNVPIEKLKKMFRHNLSTSKHKTNLKLDVGVSTGNRVHERLGRITPDSRRGLSPLGPQQPGQSPSHEPQRQQEGPCVHLDPGGGAEVGPAGLHHRGRRRRHRDTH